MHCPYCDHRQSEVIETRDSEDLDTIRRRRMCTGCQRRFTTYERVENMQLFVIKRDGRREQFNQEKLKTGILKACEKTKVPVPVIEKIVIDVLGEIRGSGNPEIESSKLGDFVGARLKQLDKVAYIRFSSVFKRFVDIEDFTAEVKRLEIL